MTKEKKVKYDSNSKASRATTAAVKAKQQVPSQQKGQLPTDNTLDGLVRGLTQHLCTQCNGKSRPILAGSTDEMWLEQDILGYFKRIEEIPIEYTRSQMIVDMIALLKAGNSGIAVHLSNLLGFESIAKEADITYVNFADVPQEFLDSLVV